MVLGAGSTPARPATCIRTPTKGKAPMFDRYTLPILIVLWIALELFVYGAQR